MLYPFDCFFTRLFFTIWHNYVHICIYIYIYTYMQRIDMRCIHTHTHTYIHTCIHTCMHTYILTCLHMHLLAWYVHTDLESATFAIELTTQILNSKPLRHHETVKPHTLNPHRHRSRFKSMKPWRPFPSRGLSQVRAPRPEDHAQKHRAETKVL